MKIFGPLYRQTLSWSRHKNASWFLGGLSFTESSFFPIPPDVMLAPMCMASPNKWVRFALIASIASVLGGLFGYAIGVLLLDAIVPWLQTTHYWSSYETAVQWFSEYGVWAVLIAGFSPVPYKIFTIAAGGLDMSLVPFILASLAGRSSRFFLVGGLMAWGGVKMETVLQTYVERIGWASVVLLVVAILIVKS